MSTLSDVVTDLRTARESVFRLECRQDYPDDPQWQTYLAGGDWTANDDLAGWRELVSANRERGVTMTRVHVVTIPWTPYVRFEVGQHYPYNLAFGEKVRLVHAEQPWSYPDFQLIDDERAWLLDYDPSGKLSAVRAAERTLPTLRKWRDEALATSVPVVPATV